MFRVSFSLLNPLPSLQLTKLQGLSIPQSLVKVGSAVRPQGRSGLQGPRNSSAVSPDGEIALGVDINVLGIPTKKRFPAGLRFPPLSPAIRPCTLHCGQLLCHGQPHPA